MSRIQGEPQRHSTPLTLGDGSDTVGVFLSCSKRDYAAALRTHLSLDKGEDIEHTTFNSTEALHFYTVFIYMHILMKDYVKKRWKYTVTVLASNSVKMKSPPSKSSFR